MILKNTSQYDTDQLKELIEFAACGIGHKNIELHVQGTDWGLRGRCFSRPFDYRVRVRSTKITNLITMKLPPLDKMPKESWTHVKRIKALWPDEIGFADWRDAVLFIAAHEFRHVWQNKRKKRTGKRGKREYDAEKFAFLRLNKWREATGRQSFPPRKQDNPFGGDECQVTNCTTEQEGMEGHTQV
jgi:hypothetical protein